MFSYLFYKFEDSADFISTFDEMPLWSAHFGILLLKHLEYKPSLTILDIGSGAGFPLMEIAARYGNSCKCYGLDPWTNANNRAKQKIKNYGLENVEVFEGSAEKIPLEDNSVDLIVSNIGINNFDNRAIVFAECNRVLKPHAKLALTTNLNGHWKEFYDLFESSLKQLNKDELIPKLTEQQEHRGTVDTISALFTSNGFNISRHYRENFEMKFVDGSAFLNHYFIKLGWLPSWLELAGESKQEIFEALEHNLNQYAQQHNGLTLTVPMAFIEGEKI